MPNQAVGKGDVPIVVDLGTASRKCIRKLKRGRGKLDAEVQEAMSQLRTELGADAENKELVPVVVVYSCRPKRSESIIDLFL